MRELHLFAGAGGGILGGILLGHTCVCAVEIEPYCQQILLQRQRDGILPKFPIWGDIKTFDGKPWRGTVDVVCGGFPCQDVSQANPRALGLNGERSGLWSEMARIVSEIRPRFVFVENSPMLAIRGLTRILSDLSCLGYNAEWGTLGASDAGLVHHRKRLWLLAYANKEKHSEQRPRKQWRFTQQFSRSDLRNRIETAEKHRRKFESRTDRIIDGLAYQMDRLGAIGNGQVPAVAKLAWETLSRNL